MVSVATMVAALIFLLVVPLLEVNSSHLLNDTWPPHARLHEAWQLISNAALSVFALYLLATHRPRSAATLMSILCGAFLLASFTAPLYGGSVQRATGDELTIGGFSLALIVLGMLFVFLLTGLLRTATERDQ